MAQPPVRAQLQYRDAGSEIASVTFGDWAALRPAGPRSSTTKSKCAIPIHSSVNGVGTAATGANLGGMGGSSGSFIPDDGQGHERALPEAAGCPRTIVQTPLQELTEPVFLPLPLNSIANY